MKITIDTKEDSHAEIQKVIKMLSSLVGQEEVLSNNADIFSDDSSNDTDHSSDIFADDSSTSSSDPSPSQDSPPKQSSSSDNSGGGIFNMFSSVS